MTSCCTGEPLIPIARPFRRLILAIAAVALVAGCAGRDGGSARYDVVLKGGSIVDGGGGPAYAGDVAISGDRIVRVGGVVPAAAARRVIDVQGLTIAPGFIDPHAHITAIDATPVPENFLRQGITTIVNSLHSLDQPYPLGTFLDRLHVAPNTVWTAGHSWVRKRVIGFDDRAPTATELTTMERYVGEAMDDGAIGLATGLEYIPATYARIDEVVALARAARRPDAVYLTHMRDEGTALMASIDESIAVGGAAGVPVHIDHIKTTGAANWGRSRDALARIDAANRAGQRVSFDVYPYGAYSTVSTVLFPGWALAGNAADYARRIDDPATRARLKRAMLAIYPEQTGGTLDSIQFREIKGKPGFAGRTLADYLRARGAPQTIDAGVDAIIDLQRTGGFEAVFQAMADRDIDAFMLHPMASISSDGDLVKPGEGFPHPRSYGAFPRVLARYVRERRLLTLEAAIAKMTHRTALALNLADRGLVKTGYVADLVVFDADRIVDRATYADPHHYAEGVVHLFVGGVSVIADGDITGARPGIAIRRSGWRR